MKSLVCTVVACASLALAASAPAAVTSYSLNASVTPSAQPANNYGGVSLQSTIDQTFSSYAPASPISTGSTYHFDDDFVLDTSGLAQCSAAALAATTTAQALAACPGAKIGSGSENFHNDPPFGPGIYSPTITSFNGPPSGGQPS